MDLKEDQSNPYLRFLKMIQAIMFSITQLYVYPVKSLAGVPLQSAQVGERGFQHDRRWMLIDENNQFITQRKIGALALLNTAIDGQQLTINHRNQSQLGNLNIPLETDAYARLSVQIWDDTCEALAVSRAADEWLSTALQFPVRLVYIPDDAPRQVEPDRVQIPMNVGFADAYPYLLIGESSLEDLNQRLAEPVPMNRFRPNIVFSGAAPYQEESWTELLIGGLPFRGVKPCGRCILTTTDQNTGLRHMGGDPLKTLASYRSVGNKVLFGMNLITLGQGVIKVGDELLVV